MMTEEEAKEKWFPFVRVTLSSESCQVSWNRVVNENNSLDFDIVIDHAASLDTTKQLSELSRNRRKK